MAGGDCINDADALRAGGTARVLGFTAKAPSTPRFREGRLQGRESVTRLAKLYGVHHTVVRRLKQELEEEDG